VVRDLVRCGLLPQFPRSASSPSHTFPVQALTMMGGVGLAEARTVRAGRRAGARRTTRCGADGLGVADSDGIEVEACACFN